MTIMECAEYMVLRCEWLKKPITNNRLNLLIFMLQLELKRKYGKRIEGTASQRGPLPTFHDCYSAFLIYGALPIQRRLSYEKEKAIRNMASDELGEEELQFVNHYIDTFCDVPMSGLYELYEREKCFA